MAYNPLQTLQAIRMQQAQRDALYLDQQNTIKAKRLEAEIQAEKANEIETYERTLKNLEREDQRKQQDFENGIRLMEKEAELSERLGRDIRGELGEITGYKGGSSIAGDEGARRENIARAGVQAKAQDTARAEKAAEEKFLRSQAQAWQLEQWRRDRQAMGRDDRAAKALDKAAFKAGFVNPDGTADLDGYFAHKGVISEGKEAKAADQPAAIAHKQVMRPIQQEKGRLDIAGKRLTNKKKARQLRLPKGTTSSSPSTKKSRTWLKQQAGNVASQLTNSLTAAGRRAQAPLEAEDEFGQAKAQGSLTAAQRAEVNALKARALRVFNNAASIEDGLEKLKAEFKPLAGKNEFVGPFAYELYRTISTELQKQGEAQ
jgi:hypothetical protein